MTETNNNQLSEDVDSRYELTDKGLFLLALCESGIIGEGDVDLEKVDTAWEYFVSNLARKVYNSNIMH